MRAFILAAALAALALPAHAADPVEGIWRTKPDDNGKYGQVRIAPCGALLCGTLIRAFDNTGTEIPSENIGKLIVWDMAPEGDGSYGGGKVWAPDRDKTYNSKMELTGSTLAVSGCVLGGLICRASEWSREN